MPNRGAATVRFASANSLVRIPWPLGKDRSAVVCAGRVQAHMVGPSHAAWHGMQCLATAQHASCRPRATRAWLAQSRLLRSAWCRNGKRSAAICSTACRNLHHATYNIHYATCTMQRAYSRPQSKHCPLHCPLIIIIRPCLSLAATAAAGCSGLNARHHAAAACAHGSGCCCRRRRHASASAAQTTRGNPKRTAGETACLSTAQRSTDYVSSRPRRPYRHSGALQNYPSALLRSTPLRSAAAGLRRRRISASAAAQLPLRCRRPSPRRSLSE